MEVTIITTPAESYRAFDAAGIEMIAEGAASTAQGRGVRLRVASGPAKSVPGARS